MDTSVLLVSTRSGAAETLTDAAEVFSCSWGLYSATCPSVKVKAVSVKIAKPAASTVSV